MELTIAVAGAAGRMGRRLVALIGEDAALRLTGALEGAGCPLLGEDAGLISGTLRQGVALTADPEVALAGARVLIEFTRGPAVPALAALAARRGVALVSGSTGLDQAGQQALGEAAIRVPVLAAPNFSLGVAVLQALAEQAAALLGPGFDVEILELHHRKKIDAPSGTALRLARGVAARRGSDVPLVLQRQGETGPRRAGEIGVLGLRGGDAVGEHTVFLLGTGERLELTHRATSRDVFAHGALHAARWLSDQPPGFYGISDLVRLAGQPADG